MTRNKLLAAAGLAFALSAMPALAANNPATTLGIDVTKAGDTDETRLAFWKSMTPEDQKKMTEMCSNDELKKSMTSGETAFCGVGLRH